MDAAKNTTGTGATATNVADDVVMTNTGRLGVGTLAPNATVEIAAKDNSTTSTAPEGILIPRVTRERAKAMTGVEEGTLIYVNDITGYNTDNNPGSAQYISNKGLYYFNGTQWSLFQAVYTRTDGSEGGVTIRKVKWYGDVTNNPSETVQCGKFKFRIYNNGSNYQIQWALVSGTKTVRGLYRNMYNNTTQISNSKNALINIDTNLTTSFTNVLNNYFIPVNDIHDLYLTYDGDTDYYQVTFARVDNAPNDVTDNLNVITCKRY